MTPPSPVHTLVLLPGLDGSDRFLRPLVEALPAHVLPRVLTYPRDGNQSYSRLLSEVSARVRDLDRYWLLGSSFGGPLALRLAAQAPSRVCGVVLSTSFARMPRPELAKWAPCANSAVIGALRTVRRLPVWLGRAPSDPFRRAKADTWRCVSSRELAARVRAVMREDASALLAALQVPLLCLAAEQDSVVPAHNLDTMRALRPDLRVARLPGSHMALFHHADSAARIVTGFVTGVIDG